MEETKLSGISAVLRTEFTGEDTIWLTSGRTLRRLIGILGMALPFLLFISLYLEANLGTPLESISHYYFTRVSGIFVATLSVLSVFFIIYKGKEPIDLIISLVAGIAALLIIFFPTENITDVCRDPEKLYSVTILEKSTFSKALHYISAGIFLGCLSYMSIFLFTRSDKPKGSRGIKKEIRNVIYRVCGVIMIVAMAVMFLGGFCKLIPEEFYQSHRLTFWMEALAVESFGFSWLIKGETLFRD